MASTRLLLNGSTVGTLRLEEFPGKVKGVQPAHSMFCSEQEPGGSILCSVLHMSAVSGGEFQLSGSPGASVVCCRAWIWQQRTTDSPQQELCQQLAQGERRLWL